MLGGSGFEVALGIGGLATAFRAVAGSGGPVVAMLAEYDALPGIGHGCGHNIIATAAAGAGIGVRAVIGDLAGHGAGDRHAGRGGLRRQGRDDPRRRVRGHRRGDHDASGHARRLRGAKALACAELRVEYPGREAHAAAQPERGINALEAMIIAYNAINSLRQHMRRTARVHGVITDGGEAPNIVPGHSAASFLVRAEDDEYLEELKVRVAACFEAGATATGATLELRWNENQYAAMNTNMAIAEAHRRNLAAVGRECQRRRESAAARQHRHGQRQQDRARHPSDDRHRADGGQRTLARVRRYAASESGDRAVIDGAKALAMTAIDILTDADLRAAHARRIRAVAQRAERRVSALDDVYGDDELAALYDLVYADYDDDLPMYEQFARRGEIAVAGARCRQRTRRAAPRASRTSTSSRSTRRRPCSRGCERALDGETVPRVRCVEADMRTSTWRAFDLIYCAAGHVRASPDQPRISSRRCAAWRRTSRTGRRLRREDCVTGVGRLGRGCRSRCACAWTRTDPRDRRDA